MSARLQAEAAGLSEAFASFDHKLGDQRLGDPKLGDKRTA
jgi:hypothetical protein